MLDSPTDLTNEDGVAIFKRAVLRGQRNYVRTQFESDNGIDAQVDIADENRVPSGRLIAVQIKSGSSYFRETTDIGWWFRFDEKHARLWFNHSLPVVVALIDVDDEKAFWARIDRHSAVPAGAGWKVRVPKSNEVATAGRAWAEIASRRDQEALASWTSSLERVPPIARTALKRASELGRAEAALLALEMSKAATSPHILIEELLTDPPFWLLGLKDLGWTSLAAFAAAHLLWPENVRCLQKAMRTGHGETARYRATAAINALDYDEDLAQVLIDEIEDTADNPTLVSVARWCFAHRNDAEPPLDGLQTDSNWSTDATTRLILGRAARQVGDLDTAVDHLEAAHDLRPENNAITLDLASARLARSTSPSAHAEDLRISIDLLVGSVDDAHCWKGPTSRSLHLLLRAARLSDRWELVLKYSEPAPNGQATTDESERPDVVINRVGALIQLGRTSEASDAAATLGDRPREILLRAELTETPLDPNERRSLWAESLKDAQSRDEPEHEIAAALRLAELGVDRSSEVQVLVDRGLIGQETVDLVSAMHSASRDLDSAMPAFRSLCRSDSYAADTIIGFLQSRNRHAAAADLARQAHSVFGQPRFVFSEFESLRHLDDAERAERAAQLVTNATSLGRSQRVLAVRYLAERAADREDWVANEGLLQTAIDLQVTPHPVDVWRLIACHLNRGDARRAAEAVRSMKPPVTTPDAARIWHTATSYAPWGEAEAGQALEIAGKFSEDTDLVYALVTHIISRTRSVGSHDQEDDDDLPDTRPIVPAELHQRSIAILNDLIAAGDGRYGRTIDVDVEAGEVDMFLEALRDAAPSDPEAADSLNQMVVDGLVPLGLMMAGLRRSHLKALLDHDMPSYPAAAADDAQHQTERDVASDALNGSVVIETSALVVLGSLSASDDLMSRFARICMARSARHDATQAALDVQSAAGSPGSFWHDPRTDTYHHSTRTTQDQRLLEDRLEAVNALLPRCEVLTDPPSSVLREDREDGRELEGPWIGAVKLAKQEGVPLWSDDAPTRALAQAFGVATFSTPALVEVVGLERLALAAASEDPAGSHDEVLRRHDVAMFEMLRERLVDLPATANHVLSVAATEEWRAWSGAIPLTRPTWWKWTERPLADLNRILDEVRRHQPDLERDWVLCAARGVTKIGLNPEYDEPKALCAIALLTVPRGTSEANRLALVDEVDHALNREEGALRLRELVAPALELLRSDGLETDP